MHKPRIYATIKRRFTTDALRGLGFRSDGSRMVKFGPMRMEKAVATSLDGQWWRVTPYIRDWR